jgi:anti-anti-sigma factor
MPAPNATRVLVSVASMTCKGGTSMQIAMRADGKRAVARLSGRFEVSAHREFRETIDAALRNDDIEEVVIDLAEVVYIDSSALGMLLMLREKANGARKSLRLPVRVALSSRHWILPTSKSSSPSFSAGNLWGAHDDAVTSG